MEPRLGAHEGARSILRLPSTLAGDWRIVRELESRGAEADLLIVTNSAGEQRVAKIYRAGIQPKTEVLQRLGCTSFEHVVRLFDHGRSDGRWYELLEYVEGGSLEDLIRQEGPKLDEMRIGQILVELLKALQHLHVNNVVHRDIKPSNVLVRSLKPFDLILTDFGIASVLGDGSRRFTTGNRTIAYSAPEAAAGEVSKASDWWSLGIMLLEMLTGRHPFAGGRLGELIDERAIMSRLAQMPVDHLIEGIGEPWRALCRGLLRREAKNRWTDAEIVRWVRRDPSLVVADEALPTSQDHVPFFFAGHRYGSLPEIARAFGANWAEARKTIERGHLLNWVKDDLKDNEWRQFLSDLDRDCPDLDERVFRIIVKLDPISTPVFYGYALDPNGLRSLADDVSADRSEAKSVLQSVFDRNILEIAGKSTGVHQYKELHDGFSSLLKDYRRFCDVVTHAGAPSSTIPTDRELPRAAMLLSVLPKGAAYVASLRRKADKAGSADARECPWFRELAEAGVSSSAALLLIPLVASAAESQTHERHRQEELTRRQRNYDEAYQTYSVASGWSLGALGGLAVGFIPCWIFTGLVSWIGGPDAGWGWFFFLMAGFSITGIVVGHQVAFKKQWVASASRDSSEARTTGLLIAIPSIVVAGFLVAYWINICNAESQRISSFVTSALVGSNIDSNGQLNGIATTFRGPKTSVVGYVNYSNGRVGSDSVVLNVKASWTRNCSPITIKYATGNVSCRYNDIGPGNYNIEIWVNGRFVRTTSFTVTQN